ncbi:unnamed protein product [Adineta steineri]|uniref:Uncharacterized protein n=1 Tax=Adineta steineri TaxID=433720 RepID=A0A815IEQ0_9BILA|nr:unnamed protein product [Adineta steineri]
MTKNRIGRENPVFELDQQPYIINTTNGSILTTKLQSIEEQEEDDEDKNNVDFEKLPDDGHSNGLFILKFRKYIIQIIQKQKTAVVYGLKLIFFIDFPIFFGFAMSDKYGTPAFPIRGNLFRNNSDILKTVFYSFVIQFLLTAVVIRFEIGFQYFGFLRKEVSKFIHNADARAIFVFGKTFEEHFFVSKITSVIIFLGAVINVLYYLGVMQYVIGQIAWFSQKSLNTTAAESMNAAANIFIGISEAPLMIMPSVPKMTTSELHSVLVGGFATMAGFEMKFF